MFLTYLAIILLISTSTLYLITFNKLRKSNKNLHELREKFKNIKSLNSANEIELTKMTAIINSLNEKISTNNVNYVKLENDHKIVIEALKKYGWTMPKRGVSIILKEQSPSADS